MLSMLLLFCFSLSDHLPFFIKNCYTLQFKRNGGSPADITPFLDWSEKELEMLGSLEVYYSHEVEVNEPIDVFQNSMQIDKVNRIFPDLVKYNSPSQNCPTSWATAAVEVAEAALKNRVRLSAKQLLECLPKKEELNDCKGVRPKMILNYLMEVGLVEEEKFVDCDSLEGLKHYYFNGEQPDVPNASGLMNLLTEKKNPVFVMVAVDLLKLRFVKDMSNMNRGIKCGGYEPALYGVVTGYHYDESSIDDSWWELRSHMIPAEEMILRMPMSMNMENANYAGIAAYAFTLSELGIVTPSPVSPVDDLVISDEDSCELLFETNWKTILVNENSCNTLYTDLSITGYPRLERIEIKDNALISVTTLTLTDNPQLTTLIMGNSAFQFTKRVELSSSLMIDD